MGLLIVQMVTMKLTTCARVSTILCEDVCMTKLCPCHLYIDSMVVVPQYYCTQARMLTPPHLHPHTRTIIPTQINVVCPIMLVVIGQGSVRVRGPTSSAAIA